ncbi:unnamed protein product [Peniophora sp. CBMAI 1063]|nr:unnamed protein product [Peniophora sp. CBMAI 1063]
MDSETYQGYPHYAPADYGLYHSSQSPSTGGVYTADQSQCLVTGGRLSHSQLTGPVYHHHPQDGAYSHHHDHPYTTQSLYHGVDPVYAHPPVDTRPFADRYALTTGTPAYPSSAIRTTNVPLHSPHPVSAASAPLLDALYAPSPASSYLPSEHHLSMADFEGSRRMSVPDLHSQHYQTDFVHTPQPHPDGSRRMSVPNLHYQSSTGTACRPTTSRMATSHLPISVTAEPPPVFQSPDYGAPSAPSLSYPKAQLAPQGSGADLMEYYANLHREPFQTPCQLLDTLLRSGSSGTGNPQLDPLPMEQSREDKEKKQTETSRQARLRYVSESVGFQTTDPDTMSCHEKKRNYIESLENYVGWLRSKCELDGVEAGEIRRLSGQRLSEYKGLNTRSVRTMIVHMQMMLRADHFDTLREEGDFLHLRERVMAQEEERAYAGSAQMRRGL